VTTGRVADWIHARSPAPPPQLLARIDALVDVDAASASVADALLDATERAMRDLLRQGCLTRDSALELLAIDALVTYAFEAAADDPDTLDARTQAALARISALAEPYEG
jgi:hypothetical protein